MKISNFIVGLITVGIVMGGLAYFYFGLGDAYGETYDDSSFAVYEDMGNIKNISDDMSAQLDEASSNSVVDLIGGFLSSGYQALKISKASFTTFTSMSEDAFDKLGNAVGGEGFGLLKARLSAIVFIIIVFIIIGVLVNKDV